MTSATGDFNDTMGDPAKFNDCTCDIWPGNEPHRHVGAMGDVDGNHVPPVSPFWRPKS
jgi:hypothetical protein